MKERGIALPWDFDESVPDTRRRRAQPVERRRAEQVGEALESEESESFGVRPRPTRRSRLASTSSGYLDAKRRSMDCHKTQRQDLGWLLDLPEDLADRAIDLEYFVLRWRDGSDAVPTSFRETWLLAS